MTALSSLRGRIFLASALLAVLAIGVAISLVNVRVTRETERELQRQVMATGALVESLRASRTETTTIMARLIADLPKLKAAVETNDPPTVQDIAQGYRDQLRANLFLIANASGRILARIGRRMPQDDAAVQQTVADAVAGRETVSLWPAEDGVLQVVTVPIALGVERPQVLGAVAVGFLLDDALASQLKSSTGSDVAFGMDGRIVAATLPPGARPPLARLLDTSGIAHVTVAGQDYVALPQPLATASGRSRAAVLVLRSRTEQLRFLQSIHAGLGATAALAVLLAIGLSFAVARTITRPLAAITDVMRDVAATGDLTRKIVLRSGHRWDDEDARLLAATFNTLTESVARFQREMAQRERLSSLGRLSTIIAHEIRNPLMIIKASLHALTRADVTAADVREAVADIDGEVSRLNRVVNDVLDFARPMRFEIATTDVNAVCRMSAAAAQAGDTRVPVHVELDAALPAIPTDGERLRAALVNMIANAQHAVLARGGAAAVATGRPPAEGDAPPVALRTRLYDGRVRITIADRGVGIDPADVGRVFDPFFTTRRGGTGLGLAIAKSVIEGLGGTITIDSAPGHGTELRIDLPAGGPAAPEAGA